MADHNKAAQVAEHLIDNSGYELNVDQLADLFIAENMHKDEKS
jgi:hypothetical protein